MKRVGFQGPHEMKEFACIVRLDTLNDENKFIYLLHSSGPEIKEVARFLNQHIRPVPHR